MRAMKKKKLKKMFNRCHQKKEIRISTDLSTKFKKTKGQRQNTEPQQPKKKTKIGFIRG